MTVLIEKSKTIEEHRAHEKDTGSPEVQIALLSERIKYLTDHFKTHRKDHSSRRGMIAKVNLRRKLLNYLKRIDVERYKTIVEKLKLRR